MLIVPQRLPCRPAFGRSGTQHFQRRDADLSTDSRADSTHRSDAGLEIPGSTLSRSGGSVSCNPQPAGLSAAGGPAWRSLILGRRKRCLDWADGQLPVCGAIADFEFIAHGHDHGVGQPAGNFLDASGRKRRPVGVVVNGVAMAWLKTHPGRSTADLAAIASSPRGTQKNSPNALGLRAGSLA